VSSWRGRIGGEWLPKAWLHKAFDLASLTDDQTDALITALGPGLSAGERAVVAARCDGVPFYIEQLVNGFHQTGVPETLYEPLFARLRLSDLGSRAARPRHTRPRIATAARRRFGWSEDFSPRPRRAIKVARLPRISSGVCGSAVT
jgi:hypothetical protein